MSDDYTDPDATEDSGWYWEKQLDHSDKVFTDWVKRGDQVVARYRDERDGITRLRVQFNILWSNIQVLTPSLYGRAAKPEVSRRYMDSDPVGRLASMMLERVLEYEVEQFPDFDAAMTGVVEDRLLAGRGTAWMRFEPEFQGEPADPEAEAVTNTVETPAEVVDKAHSPVDYVFWKDFRHSPARTWDEVWWVARQVYMDEDEGLERFGEAFKFVPLNAKETEDASKNNEKVRSTFTKKAKVWEIWNKKTAKVCWLADGYPKTLDERDDPLQLEGFFPCPKPLLATTTNGSLIPVPDYCEYQDQAQELDDLTNRIHYMVQAVKAIGVYNAEFKELARMLSENVDNQLFPVDQWANLSEKGGLKGAVDMLDITVVLQALGALYAARESVKQTIYEICGISDILRGATDAQETLGAQQLKANFGSLRLKRSQADVARFATDIFRLKAQIICKFYPPQLIVQMSGIQQIADGQDQALLSQALQMLQNSTVRDFSIAVESDSLAQIDDEAEKAAASEAIAAIGGFLKEAIPMVQGAPETLPMVSEMLLFLVRRFRAGRVLESAIERAMKALEAKAAQAAQNPQPSEAEIEATAQQQSDQLRAQTEVQANAAKAQQDAQVQQSKLQSEAQLEREKMQQSAQLAQVEGRIAMMEQAAQLRFDKWKAEFEAATQIKLADMAAESARAVAAARPAPNNGGSN